MNIDRVFAVLAAGALGALGAGTTAQAQSTSNGQLFGGGVMSKFSASDVSSMLGDFEIATSLVDFEGGDSATMLAETSGGARFIISMKTCDNLATATGCERAMIYTAIPNAGFAYEDLNNFNLGANITKAMNLAEQNIIIFGTPIYARGGIGRDNFKLLAALFLNDMQKFSEAQNAAAAEVSFGQGPKPGGKLDNIGSGDMAAQDTAPLYSASMKEHALSAAIVNTWKVEFLSDETKADLP